MRVAVVSDIHGNVRALEAIAEDMSQLAPDLVVNLGDHLSGPLWASETADFLMSHDSWIHIRGNHDRQMVELPSERMGASDRAAAGQLTARQWKWLAALPATCLVADGVFACHGTPESDSEYLIEDVSHGHAILRRPAEVRARLAGRTGLVLCGHSHVARFLSLAGEAMVANPGSVGLQAYDDFDHAAPHIIEGGSPHARYLVIDLKESGVHPAFRIVPYPWEEAARKARAAMRDEWARALETGYWRV